MQLRIDSIEAGRVQTRGPAAGQRLNPIVFLSDVTSDRHFVAIAVNGSHGSVTVVQDAAMFQQGHALYLLATGYAGSKSVTHHGLIMGPAPPGLTIDHVNRIKTDNRKENLRFATDREQAFNRGFRVDKTPAPPELLVLGIKKLPKGMRWDAGEEKFVVDVAGGSTISGTKSAKVSYVNKFRDCLGKLAEVLAVRSTEADEALAGKAARLAEEYNDIVRAAHAACPESFPDGPYTDPEDLKTDLMHCKECLACLPCVQDGEVLHGALNLAQGVVTFPQHDAIGIAKAGKLVILDGAVKDIVSAPDFPAVDVTGCSPVIPATAPLRKFFPSVVTEADVARKKKFLLKDLVWSGLLRRPREEDTTIVPVNHQQFDVRAGNLMCLPGGPKSHKGPEAVPRIDPAYGIAMRFWPRGVTLALSGGNSATSPWTFTVKTSGGLKRFTCSDTTVREVFDKRVMELLRAQDVDFDAQNEVYQGLLDSYIAMSTLL